MRLVCPNCAAQYEVDDSAIPEAGRNVQCASCGDTWFQDKKPPQAEVRIERPRRPAPQPARPDPDPDLSAFDDEDDSPSPPLERARVDPSVLDILRSEAEHENNARQAETGSGADAYDDEDDAPEAAPGAERLDREEDLAARARAARERLRGGRERRLNLSDTGSGEAEPGTADGATPAPRRAPRQPRPEAELPDLDELNSTLRSADDKGRKREQKQSRKKSRPRRRGAGRFGFYLAVLLALLAAAAYALQGQIGAAVPEAQPYLEAYVDGVNAARRVLDGLFQSLVDLMRGLMEKYL
jgi:predicted Zn finger-like uncharacterized protein